MTKENYRELKMKRLIFILGCLLFCTGALHADSKTSGIAIQKVYEDYPLEKILSLAKQGDANAQYDLSERYRYGIGGLQKNQPETIKWVKLAAAQHNSGAQNSLGYYYGGGIGVQKSRKKALSYFKLAADQGHRIGIYNVGLYYMMGRGVKVNQQKAAKLFKKAVDLGYIPAKVRLGFAYDDGAGVKQDKRMAFKLYKEAALLGEPNGQNNLAGLYYSGKGIPENYVLAMMWYNVSSMNGNRRATRGAHYNYLVNNMRGSDITKAENLAVKCLKSHYKQCEE